MFHFLIFLFCVVQGFSGFNMTWNLPAFSLADAPKPGDRDSHARIAISPSGNAVATWGRTTGKGAIEEIWVSLFLHNAKVWLPAKRISSGGNAENAQVIFDKEENIYMVWEEGFPFQIMVRKILKSDFSNPTLSEPAYPIAPSPNGQIRPHLAVNAQGSLFVSWMEFENGKYHIHASSLIDEWHYLGRISTGNDALICGVALDEQNLGAVLWQEGNEIKLSRIGKSLVKSPLFVAKGTNPSFAMDPQGNGVIVWEEGDAIFSKSYLGNALSEKLSVSHKQWKAKRPFVAIDQNGNAVIVFERFDARNKYIAGTNLAFKAKIWAPQIDISGPSFYADEIVQAGFPVLSMNEIGDGVAVWREFNGSNLVIQGAGYSLGSWSLFNTLSSGKGNTGSPFYDFSVAMNNAGNIIAVWPEDLQGNGAFQVRAAVGVGLSVIAPPPPNPPVEIAITPTPYISVPTPGVASGVQVMQRFPAHADLINVLKWESPPNIAYFMIYRGALHSLIGTSAIPYYEDHRRKPHETVTYLITSVDANGHESAPLTLMVSPLDHPDLKKWRKKN